jgi:two-component system chemotaxis sensor kinase CheA
MEVKAEYLAIFSEEATDQLREWEESLLALEKSPGDKEPLNNMFRAIHTLKGSAGFIGFDGLQKLAHDLESSLSSVRDGARRYDGALGDLLFKGLDLARSLIDLFTNGQDPGGRAAADLDVEGFLARLAALADASGTRDAPGAPSSAGSSKAAAAAPKGAAAVAPVSKAARPKAAPPAAAAAAPPAVPSTAAKAAPPKTAGTPEASPGTHEAQSPARSCTLVVRIEGQNREAYLRSCLVKARLDRLGTVTDMQPSPEVLRESTEPFVYSVTMSAGADAAEIASSVSIDQVSVAPAPIEAPEAPRAQSSEQPAEAGKGTRPEEVVRVSVQKLDTLLNLVGELVIHNSGFVATTQQLREKYGKTAAIYDLEEKTEALSAITRDLQDGIMKARMLPIASVFNRFRRVVRDLAKSSGKSVMLDVFGEETEIDKKVIDRIGEPLVHLVRNAVDHGLEPTSERTSAGKPEAGTIRLGAYQEGDHICIEVSDDGRGLDRGAILSKALEKGLISSEEAPRASAEQVLGFIFLPGFSTALKVSDISGRGVGMDAVKRAVDEMNGNVRVKSTPGAGTTVTISLPLTMAIITAVLVEASGSTYAIPMSAVREIVKTSDSILRTVGTRRIILLRSEVLALVNLAGALKDGQDVVEAARAGRPVIVVDFEGRKIALEVDEIHGSREVVIKSLSRHYREVEGLIGASILGNGKIALIVDVETMISRHHGGARVITGAGASADPESAAVREMPLREVASRAAPPQAASAPAAEPPQSAVSAPAEVEPPRPIVRNESMEQLARDVAGSKGRLLEDVNNAGAIQASMSLTQLMGHEIRVSFPESRLVAIKDVAEIMGGEESTVGGMYVGVQGDLEAGMLLVIPEKNILVLDDMLHRRPAGTTKDLAEVDLSGISELGNIMSSCFINAMADEAHLHLSPEVPEISVDMCLPVIDSVLARFNEPGEKLLLTSAVIYSEGSDNVVCHQVMFLAPDSLRKLMSALAGGAASMMSAPPVAPNPPPVAL